MIIKSTVRSSIRTIKFVGRILFQNLILIVLIALAFALVGPSPLAAGESTNRVYRLPSTDILYKQVKDYVEEVPRPGYAHASDKACEEFQDMKYGVRIHWGLYSIQGLPGESWPYLKMDNAHRAGYASQAKTWNPTGFDAEEWMRIFEQSGMRCFAFTTKHLDGFSMFDTRTRVKRQVNWVAEGGPRIEECDEAFSIMESPFKRDVVRELCDAARRHDIKIDLYFSHPDWHDADFRPYDWHPLQTPGAKQLTPGEDGFEKKHGRPLVIVPDPTQEEADRMIARHREQVRELLTRYGKIDMLCLDMWLGPKVWPQLRETVEMARGLQPDVMLRARGIGNYGDYYTPEGFVPGSKENTDMPWMVIYPLGRSFSYESEAAKHKGATWVVKNLVDAVAKGGNFMVGIGPDGNGRFHPTAIAQLEEVGAWLKINGQAIYATRPRPGDGWKEGEGLRFTRSKDGRITYVISLNRPADKLVVRSIKAQPDMTVRLLGYSRSLKWSANTDGIVIEMPADAHPALAYAFEFSQGLPLP